MTEAKTVAKRTNGTVVPKLTVPVARANDDEDDEGDAEDEEEEEKGAQEDRDPSDDGEEGKTQEPKTAEIKSPAVAQLRISKQDAEEVTFVLRSQLTQAALMKQFERRGMDARRVMIDSVFVRDARPKADRKEDKSRPKVSAEQVCNECNFFGDEPPVDRDWERPGFASDKFYRVEKCALGSPLENRWPFFGDYPGAVPAHVSSAYLDDGACPASTAMWRAAQAHQPETNHLVVTRFSAPTRGSVPYPPTAKHLVNDSFIFDYNLGARRQLLFRQAPPTGRSAKSGGGSGGGGGGGGNKSRKKQLLKQDVMHTVLLEDGSLFVLGPRDAQETVREAVVDAASADRVGVSLTFRATKTFKKPSGMKALVRKLGHAKSKVARAPAAPKPRRRAPGLSKKAAAAAALLDDESTDSDVAVAEDDDSGEKEEEEEDETKDAEKIQQAVPDDNGGNERVAKPPGAAADEKSNEKRDAAPPRGATETAGRKRKLDVADEIPDSDGAAEEEEEEEEEGDDDEDEEEEEEDTMDLKTDRARAGAKSAQANS